MPRRLAPEEIAVEPSGSHFTVERTTLSSCVSPGVSTFGMRSRRSASRASWASRRDQRACAAQNSSACPDAWNASMPERSTSSSITRIRPTRWRARCVRCARRRAARSPSFSDAAAIATAESGPRWARSPRVFADRLYVTSDNPRSEDPQAIADAIVAGIGDRDRSRRARSAPRDRTRDRARREPATSCWSPVRVTRPIRSSAIGCCRSTTPRLRARRSRSRSVLR